MIKLTNGNQTITVTAGAFENTYKKLGFKPVSKKVEKTSNDSEDEKVELTAEELFVQEILEKPLSQWNKNEVKKFAEIKDVDLSGTKSADEAKDRINQYLEENL